MIIIKKDKKWLYICYYFHTGELKCLSINLHLLFLCYTLKPHPSIQKIPGDFGNVDECGGGDTMLTQFSKVCVKSHGCLCERVILLRQGIHEIYLQT